MRIIAGLIILIYSAGAVAQPKDDARVIYNKMMQAIEHVNTCTFILNVQERVYDKQLFRQLLVKQQVRPLKVYVYSIKPDAGAEVLFMEGENNGKALINPNRFPFFTISLLPTNSLLRKNHQYTINQMGFGYLYNILRNYEQTEKDRFYSMLRVDTILDANRSPQLILEIINNQFGFINYKVMKGEDVSDIAKKFHINDQMILEMNKDIKYYDDVKPGQVLTIPNSFAKRIVFHLDKKSFLPLTQIIYDHKGLYSKIEFTSFVLNPALGPHEFSRFNEKYDF